jgi:acetylornithine deacetylase/succinyl-diaminopimelate desuccinylase-like protein
MGEEEGQVGMRALLEGGLRADAFVSVQWSTPRRLAIGYRGLCWVELRTSGRAAHGSRPAEGINAVEHMVDLVLPAVKAIRLPRPEGDAAALPEASVNLGSIQGGEAVNLVPDACRATLDFRLTRGQRSQDVVDAIDSVLSRLRAAHSTLVVERRVLLQVEPVWTDAQSALVQRLSAAIEEVTGAAPELFAKTGTSDANLVHERLHIPAVAFGPGNDSGHAPDEWVSHDDLTTAADIYAAFIPRFFAQSQSVQDVPDGHV